jgi:hypothetical protein
MTNRLEDVDLALEVLEELGGELLARDGLDRHWLAGPLLGGGKGAAGGSWGWARGMSRGCDQRTSVGRRAGGPEVKWSGVGREWEMMVKCGDKAMSDQVSSARLDHITFAARHRRAPTHRSITLVHRRKAPTSDLRADHIVAYSLLVTSLLPVSRTGTRPRRVWRHGAGCTRWARCALWRGDAEGE